MRVRVLIAVPISRSSKLKGAFPYVDEDRSHSTETVYGRYECQGKDDDFIGPIR